MNLLLATPSYAGSAHSEHSLALLKTHRVLQREGIGFRRMTADECPWVGHARADLTARFMTTDCDAMLFVDADVSWQPEDVLRMLRHEVDLVAAVQPDKLTGRMIVGSKGGGMGDVKTYHYYPERELMAVSRAATCFMMIRRRVIEKMIEAYPHLKVSAARFAQGPAQKYFYGFFAQPVIEGEWPGEDDHFCDLWTAIGGQIFIDPWLSLTHSVKVRMTGRLADQLQLPPRQNALELMSDQPEQAA